MAEKTEGKKKDEPKLEESQVTFTQKLRSGLRSLRFFRRRASSSSIPSIPTRPTRPISSPSIPTASSPISEKSIEKSIPRIEIEIPPMPPMPSIPPPMPSSPPMPSIPRIEMPSIEIPSMSIPSYDEVPESRVSSSSLVEYQHKASSPLTSSEGVEYQSARHRAGETNVSALYLASKNGQVEEAKSLIERGAQINLQTSDGTSALHIASRNDHVGVAKLLLEKGAKVDLLNNDQCSPLMVACEHELTDVAEVLLEHDADTYLKNKKGQTALEIAKEKNHVGIISLFAELKEKSAYPGILFSEGVKRESITSDEKTINLEDVGISITFPKNSLPSTDPPLEISIQSSFSGSFELPDGIKSVSPAYIIKCNRKITFLKDVILKIRHYANLHTEEDCEKMVFLSARCRPEYRGSSPVYVFKEMAGTKGLFWPRQEKPLGEIQLKHFSIVTIGIKRPHSWIDGSKLYSARLFRREKSAIFCMCLYQPMYMKQCEKVIRSKYSGIQGLTDNNCVTLSSNEVALRASENKEWKVVFDKKPKISRTEIEIQEDYQDNFKELLDLNYPPRIVMDVTLMPMTPNLEPLELLVEGLNEDCIFNLLPASSPLTSSEGVDYQAARHKVKQKQEQLEDAIVACGEVKLLATKMNAAGIMADGDHDKIQAVNPQWTDRDKAGLIVRVLRRKVGTNSKYLEKFMEILGSRSEFSDILDVLQTTAGCDLVKYK